MNRKSPYNPISPFKTDNFGETPFTWVQGALAQHVVVDFLQHLEEEVHVRASTLRLFRVSGLRFRVSDLGVEVQG